MPEVYEENRDILDCFTLCVRKSDKKYILFDWDVIIQIAKDMKIKRGYLFYQKLMAFEQTIVEINK